MSLSFSNNSPVLTWLSPLEPSLRHQEIRDHRVEYVGEWLLKTEEFRSWYASSGGGGSDNAVLFCYGDQGAGKSYISSLVIDSLCDWAGEQNFAVACFYFDLAAQKEQSSTSMLGALLKQVVGGLDEMPGEIAQAYENQRKVIGGRRPQLSDIVKMLQATSSEKHTFICIDALDECAEKHRVKILDSLHQILQNSPGTRIFVTARPLVRAEIGERLSGGMATIAIIPKIGDVIRYLRARLEEDTNPDAMDSHLEADILMKIPEDLSKGFLRVSQITDAVLQETTIDCRRQKLNEMVGDLGLGGAYGATLGRIERQGREKARLGMATLMWISHAERPLEADGLCHALAVEIGSPNLNSDNIPSIGALLTCCQGLVVVDKEASTVRLTDPTLQEHLRAHPELFGTTHSTIAETCLSFLNSQQVKALSASPSPDLQSTPFLQYSSLYWAMHAKREPSDRAKQLALELFDDYKNLISTKILLEAQGWYVYDVDPHKIYLLSGLHYASILGVDEIVAGLAEVGGRDIRDAAEEALFQESLEGTVEPTALPKKPPAIPEGHIVKIEKRTRIKASAIEDVARYSPSCELDRITEPMPVVKIDKPGFNDFIELFWERVPKAQRRGAPGSTLLNALKGLWLIPLGNQMFQRIGSTSEYPVLDVSANKGIGSFLKQAESALANRFTPEIMHLYTGDEFPHATKSLQELGIIKDYDDRASLMKWLEVTLKVFAGKLDYGERMELIRHLLDLSRDCSASMRLCMEPTVRKLPIFQEANDLSPSERPWISIANDDPNSLVTYVGVENLPITLDTPQHIFIDTECHELKGLASYLQLFKRPSRSEILGDHVVPSISETGTPNDKRRERFIKFALDHFKSLSAEARFALSTKEIAPVSNEKLRRPKDTVSGKYVAALYFEEEERCATKGFSDAYRNALARLGMPEDITDEVILERIRSYSSSGRSRSDINDKVYTLFLHGRPPPQPLSKEYMELCWIPATSSEGKLELFSALQCRSRSFRFLCNYSMPVMKLPISRGWEKWLGWDCKLTVEQMNKQLRGAKKRDDRLSLAHLVEYWYNIYLSGKASPTVDAELKLDSRRWIPGSSGGFFSLTEIFFTGATHLPPYYDIVCERFLKAEPNVRRFLTHIGVKPSPTFDQLKELQDRIATEEPLSAQDLDVALYIVEQIAIRHDGGKYQDLISDFRAPDQGGVMRAFSELTVSGSDASSSLVNRPTLHPRISESTIKKLGLPTVEDEILASPNDTRCEQAPPQTQSPKAVIRDTLQRYSVESTFSEYLANAEGCADRGGKTATRIDWMVDNSTDYPTEKLIAPELEAVQGKALFCYNNSVFTDEDFRSIIDVGIGSKGQDFSKIGRSGKGALTMYHWTSAPSFVSGDFYVIFDPENSFLPPLPLTGKRRGGLKFRIRDVQAHYPDQLKPFEGVFGFSAGSPRFEGTIFRFPFRGLTDKSMLSSKNITSIETCSYLEDYEEKARISLIFLKNISSISYWQKGLRDPIWTVSASSKPLRAIRSPRINEVEITVTSFGRIQIPGFSGPPQNDKWWTIEGFTEEQHIPAELVELAEHNRLEATYGLAIPERPQPTSCFMGLPLQTKYHLSLPASINANMALQSDRRTPISEEKNGNLEGLKWNNWIFKEGIARLYLLFLRSLMKLHGTSGYRFWPMPPSELKNPDHASWTISTEFWKKAGESSFDLYPQILPSLPTPQRSQLQASENLSIKKTIFDFLSTEQSKFIVPLLMQLGITNIATPPPTIVKGLTKATAGEVSLLLVTPAYVRDLLRNPTRCKLLQDHWKKDPESLMSNINKLLSFLLEDTSEDFLTGCSLLPLDGGSWGTFSQKSTSRTQYFISRTPLECSILEVAAGSLLPEGLEPPVIEGLLEKGMNISPLTFSCIASLYRLVESKKPEYRKAWLANVWKYFGLCVAKHPAKRDQYLESIESLPVYCGSVVGEPDSLRFLTPLSFMSKALPAIDPNTPPLERGKSTLFQALNGLILLDKSTFPTTELFAESIESPSGVCRLVKAIGSLPSTVPTIRSLSQVLSGVPMEGIEALSKLILPYVSDLLDGDYLIVNTLKHLPIWPVLSPSSFQSAAKLKLAPHENLTLTKMIDQTTFLKLGLASKYRNELKQLGVPQLSYSDFLNNEVGLARKYLHAKNIGEYQMCIEMVHKENPNIFYSCNLAVDGDLCFRSPSTLYDSSVPLFQAAFRDQQRSRFLHPELAKSYVWRDFLIENVSGPAYLECARSIERRNSQTTPDNRTESDARVVFDHLCWGNRRMHFWSVWEPLLKIRFAPIQDAIASSGESQLRRKQREQFRQRNKLVTISEAVDPKFEGISWTVKPVLWKQISSLALKRITSKKPMITPTTVIGHLEFLASHREEITENELLTRISEIKEAYEYLEGKIPSYTIEESALIWLNIENEDLGKMTLEIFRKSWSCSRNLCLNSDYDPGEIKRVHSFLGRFHQLLLHANVPAVTPPSR